MLRLIRLYSDEDHFEPIDFKPGLNIIRGSNSKNESGEVESRRQNGVGKSLSIDLIDFCMLRSEQYSRIFEINDKYLPRNSYVNLHFKVDDGEYILSRNKADQVLLREVNGLSKEYGVSDAKRLLGTLIGIGDKEISLRDYMNFFIKNEDYTYTDFNELYRGTYTELMKIHFYMFDLSISELTKIQKALEQFDAAKKVKTKVNAWLKQHNIEIEQLKARRNDLDERIRGLKEEFDYASMVDDYADRSAEIAAIDQEIAEMIEKRSLLMFELEGVDSFISDYGEDLYIDDHDVKLVFEKFKKGLGTYIQADLGELLKFRDQLSGFRSELVLDKKSAIRKEIDDLSGKITDRSKVVNSFYKSTKIDSKTNVGRALEVYQQDILDMKEYDTYLKEFEVAEEEHSKATIAYNEAIGKLAHIVTKLKTERESFNQTFVDIHKDVAGNSAASFDFQVGIDSKPSSKKAFFTFKIATETNGNKGANQMRAAIYDAALHYNSFTAPRTIGFLVHDNLLFGNMDQESSIQFLNEVNKVNPETFQYIATANSDQFDYKELEDRFSFNISERVVKDLTRAKPLFRKIYPDFIK
jgi:predicted  nucleic acid-binding Zn-ribbon protein